MKTLRMFAALLGVPFALVALGLAVLLPLPAWAVVNGPFYVDPGGNDANACITPGAACQTIGGAVGKAGAGATIHIAAGVYTETVTVPKALKFIGAGADVTIVDGGGSRVFNITAGPTTLQALALRNGNAGSGNGGALLTGSPLTLTAVTVSGSQAWWGGGVYATADVVVSDSRFEENTATGPDVTNDLRKGGGGLYVTGNLVMTDTDFYANRTAGDGGGLSIRGDAQITGGIFERNLTTDLDIGSGAAVAVTGDLALRGTQMISNTAGQAGGAIVAGEQNSGKGGDVTVIDSRFEQNKSLNTSGGALYTYGSATIIDSQFLTNTAATRKGAVSVAQNAVISGSLFQDNAALGAANGWAGALDVEGAAAITNSTFLSNTAALQAGAVKGGVSLEISGCRFEGNTAGTYAGAVEIAGSLNITGSTFSDNAAGSYGGALYSGAEASIRSSQFLSNTAASDGGALAADGALNAEDSEFLGNTATAGNGGALVLYNDALLRNVTLRGNAAGGVGGAAAHSSYGILNVTGSAISDNRAANGGAFYNADMEARLEIAGSTVTTNTATANGGALYNTNGGALQVITSTLAANGAGSKGGGVYNDAGGVITFTSSFLTANAAASGGAIHVDAGAAAVVNAVLAGNGASGNGAAIYSAGSTQVQLTTVASPTLGAGQAIYIAGGETVISSTIVASYTTGIQGAGGTTVADFNLFYGNTTNKSGAVGGGANDATGDPRFLDPAAGDYRVAGGSAALGRGTDAGVPADLPGALRGAPPTAGAYERPVTPGDGDAYLADLAAHDAPLDRVFTPTQLRSTSSVGREVTSTVVTPTASAAGVGITVNGTPVGSGNPSPSIPLTTGPNTITTVVTALDGVTTVTYTLAITQRAYDGPFYVDQTVGSDANLCDGWAAGQACATVGGAIAKAVLPHTYIYISGHTYTENLTVTLPLHFVGSGIDSTVIDGNGASRVFHILGSGSAVSLAELTVANGRIAAGNGGGIFAAGPLTLTNTAVISSSTGNGSGGGVYAAGPLVLDGAVVMSNTATGIAPTVDGVTISGGGVYAAGPARINGGRVENNAASTAAANSRAYGGGVYAAATLALTDTQVVSNTASSYHSTASGTYAQSFGGGVYAAGAMALRDSQVLSNTVRSGAGASRATTYAYGGGVYAANTAAVNGGLLAGNTATAYLPVTGSTGGGEANAYGGGLYAQGTAAITGTRFVGNGVHRGVAGTATYDYRTYNVYGGGVYAASDLALNEAEFTGNTGLYNGRGYGGGVYAAGETRVTGGLLQSNVLSYTADIVAGNGVSSGGGLYARSGLEISGTAVLSNANLANNWYLSGGGGVYAESGATIANARFAGNRTRLSDGGGVYAGVPTAVTNTIFQENAADGAGYYGNAGGLLVRGPDWGGGTATITGTRFLSNTAASAGGALLLFGTSTTLNNSEFIANSTPDRGGAIFFSRYAPLRGANLLFLRNTAGTGAALYNFNINDDDITLDFATIAAPAPVGGTAIFKDGDGTLTIRNSIFANYATSLEWAAGSLLSDYNLFYNSPTNENPGEHSLLDVDPLFVEPAQDNYRLQVGSPASAVGSAVAGIPADLVGKTRAVPPTLGAYEEALDLNLSNLTLSRGTLTPAFVRATTVYTARVPDTQTSLVLTPTASSPLALLTVNGITVTSGAPSGAVPLAIGANPITITVAAPDGVSRRHYVVTVTRTGADLLDLALSSGPLTPAFVRGTTEYTASVPNIVRSVTVTPTAADGGASITVNGAPVVSGASSQPIPLVVGSNPITTVVTAPGGAPVKTYTITISRPPSDDAGVTDLALTTGVLAPAFVTSTTEYAAAVGNGITRTAVIVTASEENARITVNGTPVVSGSPSPATDLVAGDNVFSNVIVAEDGSITNTYTITVTRAALDLGNASLANLVLGPVPLNPAFAVATTSYTATVPYTVTTATITPTVSELTATVTVSGVAVLSGSPSDPLPLAVGVNTIPVVGTAPDGVTTRTYTVAITREPWKGPFYVDPATGSDGNQCETWGAGSACATIAGAAAKAVLPDTTIYLTGTTHAASNISSALSLHFVGAGQDSTIINGGGAGRVFNFTGASSNVTLRDLTVQNGSLASGDGAGIQAAGTLSLTNASVLSNTTASGSGAGIYANGALTLTNVVVRNNVATAGSSGGGVNAQNGAVITGSLFSSNRAVNGGGVYVVNGGLSVINSQFLTNTGASNGGGAYVLSSSCTVTGSLFQGNTAASSGGGFECQSNVMTVDRSQFIANSAAAGGGIHLEPGRGLDVTNSVFAANSASTAGAAFYYAAASGAADGNLRFVTISSPTAGANSAVAYANTSFVVKNSILANYATGFRRYASVGSVTSDYNLFYSIDMTGVTTGTHSIDGADPRFFDPASANYHLRAGSPAIGAGLAIAGIPADLDGAPRETPPTIGAYEGVFYPYDVDLTNLEVSSGALAPAFNSKGLRYTAQVASATDSVILTPTASSPVVTITVDGLEVASGAGSQPVALAVGANVITTSVTATDAVTVKDYVVTITRSGADLAGLVLSSGPLTPAFDRATTGYTSTAVPNLVTSVTLTPTAADNTASITVNGAAVASGAQSGPLALAVGPNVLTVTVSAESGAVVKTYTVTVERLPSGDANLRGLALTYGVLAPSFISSTTGYAAAVPNAVASVAAIPTAKEPNASITVNDSPVTSGAASSPIPLIVGDNTITTVVTAQDGAATATYVTVVTRAPADAGNAALANLVPASGTLTPAFAPATLYYTTEVPYVVASFLVTPTAGEVGATLAVNDTPHDSGLPFGPVSLAPGVVTTVTTAITAPDNTTSLTYVLAITRRPWEGPFYVDWATGDDANQCDAWGASRACRTVGGAIAKSVLPGTTIYIAEGVYTENLTVTLPLNFVGSGAGNTFVDGARLGRVFNITATTGATTLRDLTVQNGAFAGSGAGINAAGPISLTNVGVLSNTASVASGGVSGGGVYAARAVTLTNVTVISNTAASATSAGNAGGLYAAGVANITGSLFRGNVATGSTPAWGGAMLANSTLAMTDTDVISNTATSKGGGVYANVAAQIRGGVFQGNAISVTNGSSTGYGGGLFANGSAVISGTQFLQNRSIATFYIEPSGGGGVYANSVAMLTNTRFVSNTVTKGDGGGLYGTSSTEIYSGVFQGNTADAFPAGSQRKGGGLAVRTGPAVITGTLFTGNQAWAGSGAAIWNSPATVSNSQFISNPGVQDGGGLFINGGLGQGTNLLFANNTGNYGAALYYVNNSGTAEFNYMTIVSANPRATSAIYKGSGGTMNVKNTIIANYTTAFNVVQPQLNSDYNLFYNTSSSVPTGTRSITGVNPLFVDLAGGDYRLQVGSPATARGTAIAGVTIDLDRKPRGAPPTIGAYEASPFDLDLTALALSRGALRPVFTSTVRSYTAQVANSVQSVTITPTASSPTATLTVNGQPVASGAQSQAIALQVGANLITTTVSSPDGLWSSNYVVSVNRIGADLKDLTLSSGPLTPVFAAGTTVYTATVPNSTRAASVTPTVADSSASIKVNDAAVASGAASGQIPLLVGTNTITTVVTARDGVTTRTYLIHVTRQPALSSLALSVGAITPAFTESRTSYTALVGNAVTRTAVIPAVTDAGAQITVNGAPVSSGTPSDPIALVVGENPITTVVSADAGAVVAAYLITVTRGPASPGDATLSDLAPSSGALAPIFAPATVEYTTSVPYVTTSMIVTPTASEAASTLTVNGEPVTSTQASQAISLAVGLNPITTVITAPDGLTVLTYTLNAIRRNWEGPFYVDPVGSNANQCDGWGAAQACQTVAGAIAKATLPGTTIYLTGTTFTENLAVTLPLHFVGAGAGSTIVDGNGTGRVFNITGAGSAVTLRDLTVQRGSVTGSGGGIYAAGALTLTNVNVLSSTATNGNGGGVYVAGAGSLSNVLLRGNGATSGSGAVEGGGLYALAPVRIENSIFQGNSAAGASNSGCGGGLSANGATAPVTALVANTKFLSNTAGVGAGAYVITGTAAFTGVQFIANRSTSQGGGVYLDGGALSGVNLLLARNSASAGAGILIANSSGASSLAFTTIVSPTTNTASAIRQSGAGTLEIKNSIVASYTAPVQGAVTSDFNLFYNAAISGTLGVNSITATNPLFMNPAGDNYRLQIGSPAIGKGVTVYGVANDLRGAPRSNPPTIGAYEGTGVDVDLISKSLTYGALSPVFAPTTLAYTSSVPNDVSSIGVIAGASDPAATIKVNGRAVVSGTASRPIELAVGPNLITTTITAPGGVAAQSYVVTVTRASVPSLSGLALAVKPINPAFAPGAFAYTTTTAPSTAASTLVTATPAVASDAVSITVAGNGGAAIACSGAAPACPLAIGDNVITVTVTTADGSAQVYTIAVPRASPPDLIGLALSAGPLTPAFISSTLAYTVPTVDNLVVSTLVTATAATPSDNISITVAANGGGAALCASAPDRCPLAVGSNVISVTVSKPGETRVYTVTVPRLSDGTLLDLALSVAPVNPAFVTSTLAYTTTFLPSTTTGTIVTATTQPGDGVAIVAAADGGAPAACPGEQPLCPLSTGSNLISATVTTAGGITRTYAIRLPVLSEARLSDLALSAAPIQPAFITTTQSYTTAVLPNAVSGTLVTATSAYAGDAVSITVAANGGAASVCPGVPAGCPLAVGSNVITATVIDASGSPRPYTVTVVRASSAALLGLVINPGVLAPSFISSTLAYTAAVDNPAASTLVTPTAGAGDAISVTVAANGGATGNCIGTPLSCPLAVGSNVITATVTAADGVTTRAYTVIVTRAAPSTDADLLGLALSSGPLTPAFISTTTSYTANVANLVASVTLTPTASDAGASISVDGSPVASGAASSPIALSVGPNVITTTVTAADAVTTRTYTVTVTRAAPPSDDANLLGLLLSSGPLTPVFISTTTGYTASVANLVTSVTLTPTASDGGASITVNGSPVTSGAASPPIALSVGPNVITTTVTAADAVTTRTYTVTVTRAAPPSDDANLLGLLLSSGPLTPVFISTTTSYTANVANLVTSVTLTPTASDAGASITVNGSPVASGASSSPIALSVGPNTITTVVTATNGITTKTYTVTVTRAAPPPPSSDASLTNLLLSSGPLTPVFISTTTSYTANVANLVTSVTLTPTASDGGASIAVNGSPVLSGAASSPIALSVGPNAIQVVVTAADGVSTTTYTVTVTRAAPPPPSSDASLTNLMLSSGPLTPVFISTTTSYTASVANLVASVTLTPTASDAGASITVGGSPVTSGSPSAPIALSVGPNAIQVVVTAADGVSTTTYTVTATRAAPPPPSSDASLAGLVLSSGPLTPVFISTTTSYTGSVANLVTSVTLTPTASNAGATITVGGSPVASGAASSPIALSVGPNAIQVVVIAADGVSTTTYTVTVTRAAPLGAVEGVVFNDLNANGVQDAGENGVANVPVSLLENGAVAATTATDAVGVYYFGDLTPGARLVRITAPGGFVAGSVERLVNVAGGASIRVADFALQEQGSIAGVVFEDLDGSGRQEGGEPGLGGVAVELLSGGVVVQSAQTGSDGLYRFTGVLAGTYLLRAVTPQGFVAGMVGAQPITLAAGNAAGFSFGLQRQGSLSAILYHDRNGNGRADSGEPGVAGVQVTIVHSSGASTVAVTDAAGRYQFVNLEPGVYQVQASTPAAWVINSSNSQAVNLSSGNAAVISFGCQARGALSGVVFQDLDGNGRQDVGETGVDGVLVQALQNGVVVAGSVSIADGSYAMLGLTPGAHLLRLTVPAGFAPVTPGEQAVILVDGGAVNVGFGMQPVSTIAGLVYVDLNGDSVRQTYESGLGGAAVAIYTAGPDHIFDTGDEELVGELPSASDGSYQFLNQAINSYAVQVTGPSGYTATTPSRVVVNLAQFWVATANFGYQSNNSVTATTFEDLNGNGVQDPGELPLSGLPVILTPAATGAGASSPATNTAATGNLGFVAFHDVVPGAYELRTAPPDASYVSQRTEATIQILPNDTASGRFGFQQIGSVTGSIYDDVDGNGRRSVDEAGLGGVNVALLDQGGNELGSQRTAADGSYRFSRLGVGSYQVRVTLPAGHAATSANPAPFTLTSAGATAAAAVSVGSAATSSITGRVFSDLNRNGVQDTGEIGVAGAFLTLSHNGAADRAVRTAVNGAYIFALVENGVYELQLELPPDFTPTTPLLAGLTVDGLQAPAVRFGVRPNLPNRAPVVQRIPDLSSKVGESVTIQVVANDADDTVLLFGASGLPAGLAIDSSSGLISGVLASGSTGAHVVTVAAADPLGASGQALFTLTVSEPTALPPTEEPALTIHLYLPEVHR